MQFNKKMSKTGGITLPAALRRTLGIEAGEKFNINLQGDGSILLKRSQGSCLLCEAEDALVSHNGRLICQSCVNTLHTKVGEGFG
ncbi:AbrB/MazE/SpoVT family DNA-binding domain-containing protein [Lysinibacillus piscis]|uniref:AbrB family transcriptional regulator n=1 Tax=Lysinibacillus piscis TaxID=2518931 RepID=A0ABQ5NGW0_9BACI|nr:AbrB/MazE/SpoVT family DNA-binding domain-containing protein [Lysinibacillus sp. KH24]GLC87515.1 AbrB family transcriptional regulator [Lysinibacillus sp. KH24]